MKTSPSKDDGLHFTKQEWARIEHHRLSLRTSRAELVHFLVMQGLDELDSIAREHQAIYDFYQGITGNGEGQHL